MTNLEQKIRNINTEIASKLINDFYLRIPIVNIPEHDYGLKNNEVITIQTLRYAIVYNIKHEKLMLKEFSNGELVEATETDEFEYVVFKEALEKNVGELCE